MVKECWDELRTACKGFEMNEYNLTDFSLKSGLILGMITNPNSKKEIIEHYGKEPIKELEEILMKLWIISRQKG